MKDEYREKERIYRHKRTKNTNEKNQKFQRIAGLTKTQVPDN